MIAYVVSFKMGTSLIEGWYSALSVEDVRCVLGKFIILLCIFWGFIILYDANVIIKYKMEIYI